MASLKHLFLCVSLLIILEGCARAQRLGGVQDRYSGVSYSNSRVASTSPKKQYPTAINHTASSGAVLRPYAAVTRTTTTTSTVAPVEDPYAEITTKKPRRRKSKIRKQEDDDPTKKESWRWRYGTWKKNYPFSKAKAEEFGATSEYRGIEEGSYFDRSNSSKSRDGDSKPFDWETTRKFRHQHRHHHSTTTTPVPIAPPSYSQRYQSSRSNNYEAFESQSRTYTPPTYSYYPTTPTSTSRPYRRRKTTTSAPLAYTYNATIYRSRNRLSPYTATNNSSGSAAYYQRNKSKPSAAIRRTSESVSYVAGSYFPTSSGSRKPSSGFAARPRSQYGSDPSTPSPVPSAYPTARIYQYPDDSQTTYNRRTNDPYAHPFSSLSGK